MPVTPCLTCGRLVRSGSYCDRHASDRPNRQTPGRGGGAEARRFRSAVIVKAGWRCEWTAYDETRGQRARCEETRNLEAHHKVPLAKGGTNDPANGVALCRKHHRIAERLTRDRPV